jgi:hypothetical protein
MLANRKNKLPQYLKAIQQKSLQVRQLNEIIVQAPIIVQQQTTQIDSFSASFIDTIANFKVS